jgi:serine-type D-Ala-D-Ala carboxypeptidase/endopeptidase (penicillin-binding protein 4)
MVSTLPHAGAKVSACVIDLRSGRVVMSYNGDLPLIPASSQKVVTIATALLELGPDFSFTTTLASDGKNLFVIGDGDPGFGDQRLAIARDEKIDDAFGQWAKVLKAAGISAVAGDLVLDESIFDSERVHPAWDSSDLGKWYAAPVGALNYNDNCVDITVRPGSQAGSPVRVEVVPDVDVFNVINKCKTGGKKPTLHHPVGTFDYILRGGCKKKSKLQAVAFPDPGLLFAAAMRATFLREGVSIGGKIRRERVRGTNGTLPTNLKVLAKVETPIADALARAGKNSQNMFAEALFKRAGFARMGRVGDANPIGSWSAGSIAANAMFERAGINRRGLLVRDGSGLSRQNRVSAHQLAELLAWSHGTPFGPYLHDSLAQPGVEGSLRKRMKDLRGLVFAKTGTMRGICALAGYVDGDSGPRFAFAILFNGYTGPSTPYRKIQDRVCGELAKAARR